MPPEIADAAARAAAATDLGQDLLVEAGAGSGKTSLLVERFLQALLVADAPLPRIAAITFTRRAAAEMQDRLAAELEQMLALAGDRRAADPEGAAGRLWLRLDPAARAAAAARAGRWIERLDEAAIGTLHAFCAGLLRRHPLAAGVPPGFQADEGEALERLLESEAPRAVSRALAGLEAPTRALLRGFSAERMALAAAAAARLAAAPEPVAPADPCDALVLLAARAAAGLRATLLQAGWIGMEDLVRRASALLAGQAPVRRAERARYDHLLVDELQDTDPHQYRILARLSFDPAEAGPRPRLFLVGDPKQSIYRFRNADLAAYERFRAAVVAQGARLSLTTNFRSRSRLLEPVNALFQRAMPGQEGLQPRYQPIDPAPALCDPAPAPPRLRVLTVRASGRRSELREAEAAVIVDELLERHAAGLPWREILVLLPKLTGLTILQEALQRAAIPYTVDGGKAFYKRQEVADFAALLRAWLGPEPDEELRPEYRPALLAFLRGALGAVPDTELLRYRRALGAMDFGAAPPDPAACPRTAAALEKLARWRHALASCPLDQLPAALLHHSGLLAAWGVRRGGAQAAANLEKAAARVAADVAEGERLAQAARRLADHLEQGAEAEQGVSEENADAVSLLTVHKAKGLERRLVLVCAFDGGSLHPERGFRLLAHEQRGYGLQLRKGEHNPLYPELAREDREHLAAEKLRLLYVALTRAREELVLVQAFAESGRPGQANHWLAALQAGWGYTPEGPPPRVDGVHFELRAPPPVQRAAARPAPLEPPAAAAAVRTLELQLPALQARHAWPSALGHAVADALFQGGDDEPEAAPLGRAAGRSLHRLFEAWDYRGYASLAQPLPRIAAEEAEAEGLAPASVLERVRPLLERLPGTPLGNHLTSLRELPRHAEIPLLHGEDGLAYSGAVDLLYRAADGAWVVADFKSDAGLEPEAARRRYAGQLRLYGRAVQQALGLAQPPRLELLLLDRGAIVELSPA